MMGARIVLVLLPVTHTIFVELKLVTLHVAIAMVTATDAVNPSPVISMIDPPPVPPRVRLTAVTLGVRDC